MLADDRVPTGRGKSCHIESVANVGPATGDGSLAAHLSGVAIDRCDTNESGDTTAIELAEFGQIGDQGVCGDISDTWNRCQQIVGGAPDGRSLDGIVDVAIQFGELGFRVFSVALSMR